MLKNKRTNKHLMKSRMPELKGASAAVIYTTRSSRRYVSDVPRCPRGRREQPKTPSRLPGQHCSSGIYSALLRRVLGVRAETAWTPPSAGGRLDRYETGTPGALVEGQEALSRGSAEAPPQASDTEPRTEDGSDRNRGEAVWAEDAPVRAWKSDGPHAASQSPSRSSHSRDTQAKV